DYLNALLLMRVNQSQKTFLSHAVILDGYVIRISIGNIHTTEGDIYMLWDLLKSSATEINSLHPFSTYSTTISSSKNI
ncbi:hypothetical protein CN488_31390, partial [Bacillus anthracis]